ncbi:MAG TPA: hypothetical protein VL728_09760, partial [Cyclobacteriaceae bacterium]|nr:hypothetical protein [Cyclobacteriaceae bacterium]
CAANELVRFAKTQAAQEGFCGLRPQNISSAVAAASGNRTKNARAVYIYEKLKFRRAWRSEITKGKGSIDSSMLPHQGYPSGRVTYFFGGFTCVVSDVNVGTV